MRQSAATAACAELSYPFGAWSLDIWEGFFKPTRAGRPSYVRCGPKGLGNLAQPSAWVGFTPTTASPAGAEEWKNASLYRLIPNITFVEIDVIPLNIVIRSLALNVV